MDTWESLRNECLACKGCSLADTRRNVVFGDGAEDAEILFIGEGPGQHEDEQGLPFVGRAGKLLDEMLEMVNLDRSKVYIANIVKCRPPQNRDPMPEERAACMPWLQKQLGLIRPKIVVCLGRIAAQQLIRQDLSVTREHGQFFEKDGVWYMATLHPAALLRNPRQKPDAFADFVALREKIGEVCTHTYPAGSAGPAAP